ncbi:MAG: cbb3-type cytochrome c oxidase subunit I, partial [Gammaproteobacteria bacterium]|nr:cbb3-type cytochrome c oxidase subunit I [Gammaproteobacteria bacterium]
LWGNPVFSGMFLSLIIFGVLGGISGVVMGTEQINIIIHNTIYVPGHFHATVATGTTLAFMAITYFLIPVLFRREMIMKGLAKWQPYIFGLGMSGVSLFLMGAGTFGVPRRHWDMGFTSIAASGMGYEFPGSAYTLMALAGVSGVLAVVGGGAYILITVGSLLFGKKLTGSEYTAKPTVLKMPVAAAIEGHGGIGVGGFAAPGTFVFALVFLATFVVYYFINWKYLASVWPMH